MYKKVQNPGSPNENMARVAAVVSALVVVSAPWARTRSISGWARITMPTAEGMMMARIPRRPKAMRWRKATMSRSAHRAAKDGVTALITETATTP